MPLLSVNDGTLARTSEIFARTGSGSTGVWVPSGQRAIVDADAYASGDSGQAMLVTGAHTQELSDADNITKPSWSLLGTAETTANVAIAPDGTSTADSLDMITTSDGVSQAVGEGSLTDDTIYTFSVWIRMTDAESDSITMEVDDKSGTTVVSTNKTISAFWARYDVQADVGSNAEPVDPVFRILNGDETTRSVDVWLPNVTEGQYPVPTIRGATPATLAATQWTIPQAAVPEAIRSGRWSVTAWNFGARSEVGNPTIIHNDGATNESLFHTIGDGGAHKLRVNGTVELSITATVWSRLDRIKYTVDMAASSLDISGDISGSTTGTAGLSWEAADLQIGRNPALDDFDGLISAIRRA